MHVPYFKCIIINDLPQPLGWITHISVSLSAGGKSGGNEVTGVRLQLARRKNAVLRGRSRHKVRSVSIAPVLIIAPVRYHASSIDHVSLYLDRQVKSAILSWIVITVPRHTVKASACAEASVSRAIAESLDDEMLFRTPGRDITRTHSAGSGEVAPDDQCVVVDAKAIHPAICPCPERCPR